MASPPPCLQLPVYAPSDAEKADPALYAANMRQYMVRIGLSSVDSGYSEAPNPPWTQGLAERWMLLGGDKVVVRENMQSKRDSSDGGGNQRLAGFEGDEQGGKRPVQWEREEGNDSGGFGSILAQGTSVEDYAARRRLGCWAGVACKVA